MIDNNIYVTQSGYKDGTKANVALYGMTWMTGLHMYVKSLLAKIIRMIKTFVTFLTVFITRVFSLLQNDTQNTEVLIIGRCHDIYPIWIQN